MIRPSDDAAKRAQLGWLAPKRPKVCPCATIPNEERKTANDNDER